VTVPPRRPPLTQKELAQCSLINSGSHVQIATRALAQVERVPANFTVTA